MSTETKYHPFLKKVHNSNMATNTKSQKTRNLIRKLKSFLTTHKTDKSVTTTTDPSFQGHTFARGTVEYNDANNIYASSTYGVERDMNPGAILVPSSIEDIQWVVENARGKRIAIRTGGHQYSGASSTGPDNIQLDLKPTFRRPDADLRLIRDAENDKVYIRSSVSWTLQEFYDFLLANKVFVPTGQCVNVCLGGHVQTGGYGMFARSFGLLGDYVREMEIVDYTGSVLKITKDSHPELFYGFLGGSPGNFGVLTHFTVEAQQDSKHEGSQGIWLALRYSKATLKALYDILVETAEDPEFERNYDLSVNVLSENFNILDIFPGSADDLKKATPHEALPDVHFKSLDFIHFKLGVILVYAQWVSFGTNTYSPALFERIKAVPALWKIGRESEGNTSVSTIGSWWLFRRSREFPHPYVKRTKSSNSTTFSKDGWSQWFSERIDAVVSDPDNGLSVSSQIQVKGGRNSMFWKNASDSTAFSWRDGTLGGTWDIFYTDKDKAEAWQDENDKDMSRYFCKDDRRVLWGSYGDWDMKKVWQYYHDPASYQRLRQIRKQADPNATFTPNPFCVEAAQ